MSCGKVSGMWLKHEWDYCTAPGCCSFKGKCNSEETDEHIFLPVCELSQNA